MEMETDTSSVEVTSTRQSFLTVVAAASLFSILLQVFIMVGIGIAVKVLLANQEQLQDCVDPARADSQCQTYGNKQTDQALVAIAKFNAAALSCDTGKEDWQQIYRCAVAKTAPHAGR